MSNPKEEWPQDAVRDDPEHEDNQDDGRGQWIGGTWVEHPEDETMVDLGGGMVVPLSEVLDDDD